MASFELMGRRVLRAQLGGETIRAISGSMVAYEGQVQFKASGFGGGEGLMAGIRRQATGEQLTLMECSGQGTVYFAIMAQDVSVVDLNNDQLQVESRQLMALNGNLRTDVRFAGLRGASSGQGLFTTVVSGTGQVALVSNGGPLIPLEVSPQYPLVVDPDAFVAAQGNVQSSFLTDVSWSNVIGGGSGEAFSLNWQGNGVVYIQPAERT